MNLNANNLPQKIIEKNGIKITKMIDLFHIDVSES
jgi:hypothetical protein